MKTQLLQDFNESGSAPAKPAPPAADPPQAPAVAPAPIPAPAAAPQPAQAASAAQAAHSAQARAEAPEPPTLRPAATGPVRPAPVRVQPRGFAPQPAAFANGIPPPGDTTAEWSPDSTGGDPEWLTERLARDTAMHDRSSWNGHWTRHLATWGAAGVLLALVAGGGLWLYEQSQVEGALVVVANTNPPPAAAASHSGLGNAARLPAIAPVSTSAPSPAAVEPAPRMAITPNDVSVGVGAAGGLTGAATAAAPGESRDDNAVAVEKGPAGPVPAASAANDTGAASAPPKRLRSQARKHPKAEASAAIPDKEPSARQRREETLMQCRAHGYDDRQCLQRGCEMTRYGFACKG
jgi:hypothetical protein